MEATSTDMDYAESTSSPSAAEDGSIEVTSLPFDRPSKEFYQQLFHSQQTRKEPKPGGVGRGVSKYTAICKKCGKSVSGSDSLYGFRLHYQTKHNDAQEPRVRTRRKRDRIVDAAVAELMSGEPVEVSKADEDALAVEGIDTTSDPVDSLSFDKSGKEFFQKLFVEHAADRDVKRSDGRNATKYTASCKKCSKRLSGLDTFYKFREHYKKNHNDNPTPDVVPVGRLLALPAEGEYAIIAEVLPYDSPAKEFYENMFSAHEALKEPKPLSGRAVSRYAADCKLCGKRITGTDSFFGFRQHYRNAHKETQGDADSSQVITIHETPHSSGSRTSFAKLSSLLPSDTLEPLPVDSLAKEYFDKLFVSHVVTKDKADSVGRSRKKFVATCRQCGKMVYGHSSFGSFKQHYQTWHNELMVANPAGTLAFNPMRMKGQSATAFDPSFYDNQEQHTLNQNVASCVSETLIPLALLTKPCFDKLVKDIDGHLSWPSQHALSTTILPNLKMQIKNSITDGLKEAPAVSITIHVSHGFFGVSSRFVDEAWNIQSPILACKRFFGQHTANTLFQNIIAVLNEYGIKDNIAYIDDDDGRDLAAGADRSGDFAWPLLMSCDRSESVEVSRRRSLVNEVKDLLHSHFELPPCRFLIHQILRTVEQIFESCVKNCQELSGVLKKIANASATLKKSAAVEHEKIPGSGRVQAILAMTKLASEFNWETAKLKPSGKLDVQEQTVLGEFVKVSKSFEELFTKLQQHNTATVCDVVPFICGLRQWLTSVLDETTDLTGLVQSFLEEINTRCNGLDDEELYMTASFLDPKYKLLWCKYSSSVDKEDEVKTVILGKMTDGVSEVKVESHFESNGGEPPKKRSALLSFLGDVPISPKKSRGMPAAEELRAYLDDADSQENPLAYWRQNCNRFKKLASLARSVFFIPSGCSKTKLLQDILLNDRQLEAFEGNMDTVMFCHINPEFASDYSGKRRASSSDA